MKKLMFAAAAIAAGVAMADVTSANVVGYVTKPALSMDYSMIGCNLTDVGGAQGVKISDLVCKDGFHPGSATTDSDWIQIWRTTGSSIYYIWDEDGLWYEDGAEEPVSDADVFKPGEAMWFFRRGDATEITLAGQVFTAPKSLPLHGMDYTMITSPYATPLKISDFTDLVAAGPKMGSATTDSDWIQVWRATGSAIYYIWDEDGLWYEDGAEEPVTDADVINPGEAAWYFHRKAEPTTLDFEGLDL